MKVAIVGKGGSGKSTVSWALVHYWAMKGKTVLAIDADYNMDLAKSLGWHNGMAWSFIHTSREDFKKYLGISEEYRFVDIPLVHSGEKVFSITPPDAYTNSYSKSAPRNTDIRLMTVGAAQETHLYDNHCSHALLAPLKYYIPLLRMNNDERVVMDGVAGTDMVAYGLFTGMDAVICVVEPTPQSKGVFDQVSVLTRELGIPTYAIANKISPQFPMYVLDGIPLIGKLELDYSVVEGDWDKVSINIKNSIKECADFIDSLPKDVDAGWQRLKNWRNKLHDE